MNKKELILATLLPYFENPETCAIEGDNCKYLTDDGRKCAFGKWLKDPSEFKFVCNNASARFLIESYGQEILKEEARGILNPIEWARVQEVHDNFAIETYRNLTIGSIGYLEEKSSLNLPELKEAFHKATKKLYL